MSKTVQEEKVQGEAHHRAGGAGIAAPLTLLRSRRSQRDDRADSIGASATRRGVRLRRVLLLADLAGVLTAAALTSLLLPLNGYAISPWEQLAAIVVCMPAFVVLGQLCGLYHLMERNVDYTVADDLGPTFMLATAWTWILLMATTVLAGEALRLVWFVIFWLVLVVALLGARALTRSVTRGRPWYRQRVMLLGDPNGVAQVARRIDRHPETGLEPVGAIYRTDEGLTTASFLRDRRPRQAPMAGPIAAAEVCRQLEQAEVQRVILAGWGGDLQQRTELTRLLVTSGFYVDIVSGEPEALCSGASIHHLEGLPIMTISPTPMTRTGRAAKRAIDVVASAAALTLLSPFLAYVAIRIKLDSPGPVLFRHARIGRNGRPFEMLKFRTMVDGADRMQGELRTGSERGLFKLRDDPRVTGFGRKLRPRSIDELPQLWNVLRGDMSLVGPRPLPPNEATFASDHFAERKRVRPGITGPWQIHGRSDIPFHDMVKLDYTYVSSWSLAEDLRLLIRTAGAVISGRGAY